jgi:hypothetical protein
MVTRFCVTMLTWHGPPMAGRLARKHGHPTSGDHATPVTDVVLLQGASYGPMQ